MDKPITVHAQFVRDQEKEPLSLITSYVVNSKTRSFAPGFLMVWDLPAMQYASLGFWRFR